MFFVTSYKHILVFFKVALSHKCFMFLHKIQCQGLNYLLSITGYFYSTVTACEEHMRVYEHNIKNRTQC